MMKKIAALLLAFVLCAVPLTVFAENEDMFVKVIADGEKVEVGDQFLVRIEKDSDAAFLTFRVNGSFDADLAQIVAPVYTNEVLGVLTNRFDNENGTFTFEGYDTTIRGTSENVVCAILFEAKASGVFEVKLEEDCMLGKPDEAAFYALGTENGKVLIEEDSDGQAVDIIKDAEPQTPYDEVIMGHWAEKGITVMYKLGVLENIAESSIEPDRNITRGEFAVMLQRVCKLAATGNAEMFEDVDKDGFMCEPIRVLRIKQIATGDGDNHFMPNDAITYQDMCTLVFRTMIKMNKVDAEIDAQQYLSGFDNTDEIAPYAVNAIAGLMRAKISDKCDPTAFVTVGEACHVLNKLAEFNILVSRN